jgi:hypothetical protein
VKLLGIDPGKSTGWARISIDDNKRIHLGEFGVTKDVTLVEIKDHIEDCDIIIYENFLVRPKVAEAGRFNWQDMVAPRVIGALTTLCALYQKDIQKQEPVQRIPGYGFSGMVYKPGAKGKHWQDALAHAVFYAVSKLGASPVKKPASRTS